MKGTLKSREAVEGPSELHDARSQARGSFKYDKITVLNIPTNQILLEELAKGKMKNKSRKKAKSLTSEYKISSLRSRRITQHSLSKFQDRQ